METNPLFKCGCNRQPGVRHTKGLLRLLPAIRAPGDSGSVTGPMKIHLLWLSLLQMKLWSIPGSMDEFERVNGAPMNWRRWHRRKFWTSGYRVVQQNTISFLNQHRIRFYKQFGCSFLFQYNSIHWLLGIFEVDGWSENVLIILSLYYHHLERPSLLDLLDDCHHLCVRLCRDFSMSSVIWLTICFASASAPFWWAIFANSVWISKLCRVRTACAVPTRGSNLSQLHPFARVDFGPARK